MKTLNPPQSGVESGPPVLDNNPSPHPEESAVSSDFCRRAEYFNALTHAIGFFISGIASLFLMRKAWLAFEAGTISHYLFVSSAMFCLTMMAVYCSSALSHHFYDSKYRGLFRKLDQAFIFLFIVSTYTPYSVAHLQENWWWVLLGAMWTVALFGFFAKMVFAHRIEGGAIWIQLILGWMPAIGGMPFSDSIPISAIWFIIGGGIFYSIGSVFLINEKKRWYFHPIWHLSVIAGTTVHFIGVWECL